MLESVKAHRVRTEDGDRLGPPIRCQQKYPWWVSPYARSDPIRTRTPILPRRVRDPEGGVPAIQGGGPWRGRVRGTAAEMPPVSFRQSENLGDLGDRPEDFAGCIGIFALRSSTSIRLGR